MPKCRRKPEEFDAWCWAAVEIPPDDAPDWILEALGRHPKSNSIKFSDAGLSETYILVSGLEIATCIRVGDYLLRDSKGNISACRAKDFDEQFEFVDEDEEMTGMGYEGDCE